MFETHVTLAWLCQCGHSHSATRTACRTLGLVLLHLPARRHHTAERKRPQNKGQGAAVPIGTPVLDQQPFGEFAFWASQKGPENWFRAKLVEECQKYF